jgi:hypothetical protein
VSSFKALVDKYTAEEFQWNWESCPEEVLQIFRKCLGPCVQCEKLVCWIQSLEHHAKPYHTIYQNKWKYRAFWRFGPQLGVSNFPTKIIFAHLLCMALQTSPLFDPWEPHSESDPNPRVLLIKT